MRGGPLQALIHLAIYPVVLSLLVPMASAAYASPSITGLPSAAMRRQQGLFASAGPAAATPVTTVLSVSAVDQLKSDLETIATRSSATLGISLQELSGPRRNTVSLNGDQSFYAASTYKLPLLMAEAQQVASGQTSPSDVLCFDPSDAEDGWFDDYEVGSCFTRDELVQRAGRYSDNTAAHILVRYLGGPDALNGYANAIGMTGSALWIPNTTTPDDLTAAWVSEALGRLGGAPAQRWLFPVLTHTANEEGIPAGLPASATVVHKVGTMYGTENDAAYIVDGPITYVLSVSVEGLDEAAGWSLIAQISARIWQYELSRPAFVAPVVATPAAPAVVLNHH
jgi:beta-lactamase class A